MLPYIVPPPDHVRTILSAPKIATYPQSWESSRWLGIVARLVTRVCFRKGNMALFRKWGHNLFFLDTKILIVYIYTNARDPLYQCGGSMKLKGPLFGISARGTIGKTLIYSTKWGLKLVRAFHEPTGPPSSDQLTQRAAFKSIIDEWNALTDAERVGWETFSYLLPPLSGYNFFLGRSTPKRQIHQFGSAKFGEARFGEPGI